jgi:hypothetical protein
MRRRKFIAMCRNPGINIRALSLLVCHPMANSSESITARCSGSAALSTQARPPCEEAEVKETWQLVELHGRWWA